MMKCSYKVDGGPKSHVCQDDATHWVRYKNDPGRRFEYCYGHFEQFKDVTGDLPDGLDGGPIDPYWGKSREWCEYCQDHFYEDHWDENDRHRPTRGVASRG